MLFPPTSRTFGALISTRPCRFRESIPLHSDVLHRVHARLLTALCTAQRACSAFFPVPHVWSRGIAGSAVLFAFLFLLPMPGKTQENKDPALTSEITSLRQWKEFSVKYPTVARKVDVTATVSFYDPGWFNLWVIDGD